MALLDLQIMEQPEEEANAPGRHSGASKGCSGLSLLLC
jgi:hypothetical protein